MAMINIPAWMSLVSFESLRKHIVTNNSIINMAHFGRGVFGSDFGSVAFVINRKRLVNYKGCYMRLFTKQGSVDSVEEKEKMFFSNARYFCSTASFELIPGCPIAYWLSEPFFATFGKSTVGDKITTREGMATADNDRFLRLWHEVDNNKIGFMIPSVAASIESKKRWFPYNKGGEFRKWYGNVSYVVNWENDGVEIRNNTDPKTGRIRSHNYNGEFAFREGFTWTSLSISSISVRKSDEGFLFDSKGAMGFGSSIEDIHRTIGLLNSVVGTEYLKIFSPTVDFKVGDVIQLPYLPGEEDNILNHVEECIRLSREDWNESESSWDFVEHPLVRISRSLWDATAVGAAMRYYYGKQPTVSCPLELCFMLWQGECNERFKKLKESEEEINRLFIEVYGLQNDLTPEVADGDITVRRANLGRDIRSLISYAVGCMFGRYSLDVPGLAYAGGEWVDSKYVTFQADKDSIIPICDDEYFADDIVGRFVRFIEVVYGKDTLSENLRYIADALGGSGQPKDVIRKYFMEEFYADHCSTYSVTGSGKRPIYWLFDSGKKGGFRALVYMHRYQPDTIARMRTDYVHEQQARYRTAIADLEQRIASASTSERVKLSKRLKTLQEQATEIQGYEEKIHHLADQYIAINLDDGVKKNYEIFKDVLAKIK